MGSPGPSIHLLRCDICAGHGSVDLPGRAGIVLQCPECGGSGQRRKAGCPPVLA